MAFYRAPVAGESFRNKDGSDRQEEIARCLPGERVTLEREPDNPHDSNCIKVISARGVQIGNIGREAAEWMAQRLDRETWLEARIDSVGAGDRGLLGVVLLVSTAFEDNWPE
jgi:hypothetical protein